MGVKLWKCGIPDKSITAVTAAGCWHLLCLNHRACIDRQVQPG